MIKVGIIGATGYAGAELYRLLINHPKVKISAVSSFSFEGKDISAIYPGFNKIGQMILVNQDEVIEKSDVIIAALPHGLSEEVAKKCYDENKAFIDFGADFRLDDEASYEKWYHGSYKFKELHQLSVYGLPEIFRDEIKKSRIIGNPGCYPTSVALGLYPALKLGFCSSKGIIIDAKSGTTGSGRGLSQDTHFPDCNEAFSPYKIGAHRHTPEIEQTLSYISGENIKVTFVPHLLAVNRGILSTIYTDKNDKVKLDDIHAAYKNFYKNEHFVRVLDLGDISNIKNVRMSNYCDISLHEDIHTGKLIIVAAIDNMVKGAAGQAVQNMNIIFGFDETEGLNLVPPAF